MFSFTLAFATNFAIVTCIIFGTISANVSVENGSFTEFKKMEFHSTETAIFSNATHRETNVVQMATTLYIYFTPCLVVLGITGNALSVYVFFTSKLRLQSTSQYLSALAISDSLFLAQLLPPWLTTIEINSVFHQPEFCKAFVYISYVTCCCSAWFVIAFTVERCVAVQYPLQCNAVCTVRRARYVILVLVVISLLINIPVLHFAGSGADECNIDSDKLVHAARFNWVDTVISFTVPLAVIIVLNTWITVLVWKLERTRMRLMKQVRAASILQGRERTPQLGFATSQQKVTRMLLIVSTVFVLFNLPAYAMRVMAYAYNMDSNDLDGKWIVLHHISAILFNLNFGINFFLYCLSGQNFRRALLQTVPCCAWLWRRSAAAGGSALHRGRANSLTTSAASNGTEPTSGCGLSAVTPRRMRPHIEAGYVLRWTFDNSWQRRSSSEVIEMRELPAPVTSVTRDAPQGNLAVI